MLVADLTPLQKLYNKGVDITAGVITSTISAGIIAFIATLAWRWKRKRDLRHEEDKQRQHDRIANQIESEKRKQAAHEEREQMKAAIEMLASRVETAQTAAYVAEYWENYLKFLIVNRLDLLPGNLRTISERAAWGHALRSMTTQQQVAPEMAQEAARIIRGTELPPME
jgi:hypothetical protein